MSDSNYDVVITGAGPVGSALALLLARYAPEPDRIALVGQNFTRRADLRLTGPDPRSIAVNHGTMALLQALNAWPEHYRPIETVHVSQKGRLGRTLIRHEDLEVPQLGSVVNYTDLLTSLHQALKGSGITCIDATYSSLQQNPLVQLTAGKHQIQACLGVQSDGARPQGLKRQYNQCAVLAVVKAHAPLNAWAFERFTQQGPLALLPHPSGGNHYGVVWCCHPETADRLHRISEPHFNTELQSLFGNRLGTLEVVGKRHVFPLSLHAGPARLNHRCIAIGNAAQTLHPVAGQGLNLGLRDAAQLAHTLRFWLTRTTTDPGPVLSQYAQLRGPDRWLTTAITDLLPRVFATRQPLIEHAAGLGLLGMDLSLGVRLPLAHHLLQGLRR